MGAGGGRNQRCHSDAIAISDHAGASAVGWGAGRRRSKAGARRAAQAAQLQASPWVLLLRNGCPENPFFAQAVLHDEKVVGSLHCCRVDAVPTSKMIISPP